MEVTDITYYPSPTLEQFHASNAFIRGVMGPFGSGKTVGMCGELFFRMCEQAPDRGGIRHSRWAVIRNTYPELRSTTVKTFVEWFPKQICEMTYGAPIVGQVRFRGHDNTQIQAEVLFISLDRADAIRKLKGLELTGGFINEASEIDKQVIDILTGRVGRYPKKATAPLTWSGIFMDSNPCDEDHWWYKWAEGYVESEEDVVQFQLPEGAEARFWKQPPALLKRGDQYVPNPEAENVENQPLGYDYWFRMIPGKSESWIKAFIQGQYASIYDGKAVYGKSWNEEFHVASDPLWPIPNNDVILCWDFGLTPACVILQHMKTGQLRVMDEICGKDVGLKKFIKAQVLPVLSKKYAGYTFESVCDPAIKRMETDHEEDVLKVLESFGLSTVAASDEQGHRTNSQQVRWDSVLWFLTQMIEGKPMIKVSPECRMIIKGFNGAYRFRKMAVVTGDGTSRYSTTPDKNAYSHPHDALQYGCMYIRSPVKSPKNELPPIPAFTPMDQVIGY